MWDSILDMLSALNKSEGRLIVLRNYEGYDEGLLTDHDDIDLLCENPDEIRKIIRGYEVECKKNKIQIMTDIASREISVDLRFVGDGYMDKLWEEDMLDRRVLFKNAFYIPCPKDYAYSLLYHGFYHKSFLKEDYRKRVLGISQEIGLGLNDDNLKEMLEKYMSSNGYVDTGYRCG